MSSQKFQEVVKSSIENGNFFALTGLSIGLLCQLSEDRVIKNIGTGCAIAGTGVWAAKKLSNSGRKQLPEMDYYKSIFEKNGLLPDDSNIWIGWNYPYPRETSYTQSIEKGGKGWNCGNLVYKQMLILTTNKTVYSKERIQLSDSLKNLIYKENITKAKEYFISQINEGKPVAAVVDYGDFNNKNIDGGDHFITIIGYGMKNGVFYLQFWDNFFANSEIGKHIDNKLFLTNNVFELNDQTRIYTEIQRKRNKLVLPYRITNIRYNTQI